jgi:O-antigen ligase
VVDQAHNGFLDVALDLGLIGLALLLVPFVYYSWCAFREGMRESSLAGLWPLVYFALFTVSNTVESHVFRDDGLFWAVYVATAISLNSAFGPQGQSRL